MSRIPQAFTLEEIQQAFRDLYELVRPIEQGPFDLNGRRIRGGDAIDPQEYVTKRQLEQVLTGQYVSNRNLISVIRQWSGGGAVDWWTEWYKNGGFIHRTRRYDAKDGTNSTVTMEANGDIIEVAWNSAAGGGIAPYSILYEWSRDQTGSDALTYQQSGTSKTRAAVMPNVTGQGGNTGIFTSPYQTLGDAVAGDGTWRGYFMTAELTPSTNQGLLIIADVAGGGSTTTDDTSGLILVKPSEGDPPDDFYLFAFNTSGNVRMVKYTGGTANTQGAEQATAYRGNAVHTTYKCRLIWGIYPSGASVHPSGSRVYAGQTIAAYDMPMTIGDSTVWASGRVGFRVAGNNQISFSRLAVLSWPATAGDQMVF